MDLCELIKNKETIINNIRQDIKKLLSTANQMDTGAGDKNNGPQLEGVLFDLNSRWALVNFNNA